MRDIMHRLFQMRLFLLFWPRSQPHTTLFLVMMRLNLKYVLTSLILMVTCVTLMLWSRCGDLVRTFPKRFYGEHKSGTSLKNSLSQLYKHLREFCHLNLNSGIFLFIFHFSESISNHRSCRDWLCHKSGVLNRLSKGGRWDLHAVLVCQKVFWSVRLAEHERWDYTLRLESQLRKGESAAHHIRLERHFHVLRELQRWSSRPSQMY